MKRYNYKYVCMVIMALLPLFSIQAQRVEKDKVIDKRFAISENARVEISNKYGDMYINTWNKDSVYIHIKYNLKAKDQKRLDKLEESVQIDVVETAHYIVATTNFLDGGKDLFRDLSSALTNSSTNSITVNYEVYVPASCKLIISNKYGNVYTTDLQGDVTFDIAYGTFKANDFLGHTDLSLNNCNASINSMPLGIITLNYSQLNLENGGSLKLNSRSSEARIHQIESISIDGKSDQIRIDDGENISLTGNFSQFEVDNLSGNFNAQTKYGNLDIYLAKAYKGSLMLTAKYTDINLRLYGENTQLTSEIRHQRSKLAYPAGLANLTEEKISGSDVIYQSSGTIGNGSDSSSKLTFFIESGDLSIFSR